MRLPWWREYPQRREGLRCLSVGVGQGEEAGQGEGSFS